MKLSKLQWKHVGAFFVKIGKSLSKILFPLGKTILIKAVQVAGDKLQAEMSEELHNKGAKKMDEIVDKYQVKAIQQIEGLGWVPEWMKESSREIIKDEIDGLQVIVRKVLKTGAPEAFNKVFDLTQLAIIERIKKL